MTNSTTQSSQADELVGVPTFVHSYPRMYITEKNITITPTVVGVYRDWPGVLSIKPVHLKFAIFTFTMEAI